MAEKAEIRNIPQNPLFGALASVLMKAKQNTGMLGEFLLGQAPETLENMSYGFNPTRGSGMAYGFKPEALDVASIVPTGMLGGLATKSYSSLLARELARHVAEGTKFGQMIDPRMMAVENNKSNNFFDIFHTSPKEIQKIDKYGKFDDNLFFSNEPYFMSANPEQSKIYKMTVNKKDLINVKDIDEEKTIKEVADYLNVDFDKARDFLSQSDSVWNHGFGADEDWFIQTAQGRAAKRMGKSGAIARDEQGTVYIMPMFGKEKDLIKVK